MRTPINPSNLIRLVVAICLCMITAQTLAQEGGGVDADLDGRLIVRVEVVGLKRVSEQEVRNTLRTVAGDPYNSRTIQLDMENLVRLGDFKRITPSAVLLEDGSVVVTFTLEEQPLLADVQVVGNTVISDQEILGRILLRANTPQDEYLIRESQRRIMELYKDRGHYKAEVIVNEPELDKSNILIFQIIEGPRVKVRAIEFKFVDTRSFSDSELKSQIKTETALFILRKGPLDPKVISNDVAALNSFFKNRGYLDVRVDRELELSPDDREAKVVFIISEGRVYTLRSVTAVSEIPSEELEFTDGQFAALIAIKTGDVYSLDKIRQSVEILRNTYGDLGYVDAQIRSDELRTGAEPIVDLRFIIEQGKKSLTGEVKIKGNPLTKDKVIRRQLQFRPGRPLTRRDLEEAERRLRRLRLWSDVDVTVSPQAVDDIYRDILVEVKEMNTGSFNFGVAVGSDQGVFGDISLNQRNFDIADWPESFEEFIRGKAFRGAGQKFSLALQPGDEVSRYSINFTEPNLLDSPISISTSAMFRQWQFTDYDEERLRGSLAFGRRFGEVWSGTISGRVEQVELTAIAPFAATDVFDAKGPDLLTGIKINATRNTTGTFIRPGKGSVLDLSLEQTGALGGDFNFATITAGYTVFFTLYEDFLGRKSILKLNTNASYILGGDAPIYERFYLGGRSFRGFEFRTISPKGIRADNGLPSDEPVGGEWQFFAGAQYEFPIFEEVFNGVVFLDSGTVTDEIGFSEYRASFGVGIRLYIPAFGQLPLAFDFAIPILQESHDEEQFFSFSVELPFR